VDHFPVSAGRIDHVVYSRPDGESSPRQVAVARGSIKTGYFPADDTSLIMLGLSTRETLQAIVVPVDLPPRIAELAMQTAGTPSNLRTAHEVLRDSRESENIAAYEQRRDDGGGLGTGANSDIGRREVGAVAYAMLYRTRGWTPRWQIPRGNEEMVQAEIINVGREETGHLSVVDSQTGGTITLVVAWAAVASAVIVDSASCPPHDEATGQYA
jgi:hypothetical protein